MYLNHSNNRKPVSVLFIVFNVCVCVCVCVYESMCSFVSICLCGMCSVYVVSANVRACVTALVSVCVHAHACARA